MHKQEIKKIILKCKTLSSYEEKLNFLKDKFNGQTCYILGCGPSLKSLNKEAFLSEAENNCLFAIKQSFFTFQNQLDFHFFNTNNYVRYPRDEKVFCVASSDWSSESSVKKQFWREQQIDICTRVVGKSPISKEQYSEDFAGLKKYTFEETGLSRKWGAGIMYENVLFFAYHLGFSNIRTVGWDYMDPDSTGFVEHYYSEDSRLRTINPCNQPYDKEMLDSINLSKVFNIFLETIM